jgi:uncharacterized protein (TIGR03435 family)
MRIALLLTFAALLVHAQDTAPKLEFEVASVKPAAPQAGGRGGTFMNGGPGSRDPSQITYTNVPLRLLIMNAYNIKGFQLTAPNTVDDGRFDILAKVPKAPRGRMPASCCKISLSIALA